MSSLHSAGKPPAPASVHSIDRFVFSVPDLREAQRFYRAFGLDVRRDGRCLALHTFGHPHCWAQVHESGQPKRLEYVRYGMPEEQMGAMRERVRAAGLEADPHPLGDAQGMWLSNPDGTRLQIVAAPKVSPSHKSARSPAPLVAPGQGAAPARSRMQPVRPRYLSHLLFFTPDVPRMITFSQDILGLRLSDHCGDIIAFLHGAHGSDHHLVAFAKSHGPGLHHSSWDVGSVEEVGCGSEQMRNAGHGQGWGVGRHVLGSNYFYYVRDPWGSYAEYSHDIDFVPAGSNWPAADHPPEDALYVWGPSVPADFITNLEQPA